MDNFFSFFINRFGRSTYSRDETTSILLEAWSEEGSRISNTFCELT